MTVRIFRSTEPGAPVLTGVAGSLIGVLDACLLNGFTPQTITSITRSGTTATVTLPTPNTVMFTGDYFTIAGAAQTDYNGSFQITVLTTTTFTYQVANSPATPATGTLSYAKKPLSTWTKEFSGTNLAAYKQGAGSMGFYTRIDDTGTTTARVVHYETMTDVNTGAFPIPTTAQLSGGLYISKSSTADATARPWVMFTNGKTMHFLTNTTSVASPFAGYLAFGDFISYKANDSYAFFTYSATTTDVNAHAVYLAPYVAYGNLTGHYIAKDVSGIGSSIGCAKLTNSAFQGRSGGVSPILIGGGSDTVGNQFTTGVAYPSPIDGGLYLEKLWLTTNSNAIRGEIPGIWCPLHTRPLGHGDQFPGSGPVAGKVFEAFTNTNNPNANGQMMFEISNTW